MFFTVRALILSAVTVLLLSLLYNADLGDLNVYSKAYQARIGFYADRIDSLTRIRSWKQRMLLRHVANAHIPQWIAENRRPTDTILLPPASYAQKYIKADVVWTDPRIFTYMAGFQPIVAWTDTVRRRSANTFIALEPMAITLARPNGSVNIDSLLQEYERSEQESQRLRGGGR